MNIRDRVFPFMSAVILSGLLVFLSCAHKQTSDSEADGSKVEEEMASDAGEAAPDAANSKPEDLSALMNDKKEGDNASGGAANSSNPAANPTDNKEVKSDDLSAALEGAAANPSKTETLPPPAVDTTSPAIGTESTTGTPDTNGLNAATSNAATPAPSGKSFSGKSRSPKMPTQALHRHNATLNRYYFVRAGDTPQTVSQLIYGTPDKADNLTAWNKGNWKPGKALFYTSAQQADDDTMRSFYQEAGLTPEEYSVQKGDWLSRVAAAKLGDAGSWKEIAVVNGLESPDAVEPGQKIALYTDLGKGGNHLAQSPAPEVAKANVPEPKHETPPPSSLEQSKPPIAKNELPHPGSLPSFDTPKIPVKAAAARSIWERL